MAANTTYECDEVGCATPATANPSLWLFVSVAVTDTPPTGDHETVNNTAFCSLACMNTYLADLLAP